MACRKPRATSAPTTRLAVAAAAHNCGIRRQHRAPCPVVAAATTPARCNRPVSVAPCSPSALPAAPPRPPTCRTCAPAHPLALLAAPRRSVAVAAPTLCSTPRATTTPAPTLCPCWACRRMLLLLLLLLVKHQHCEQSQRRSSWHCQQSHRQTTTQPEHPCRTTARRTGCQDTSSDNPTTIVLL